MRIVTTYTPGRREAGASARNPHSALIVRHFWQHECGTEAIEALALLAAILSLLAVISIVFRDRAADIGSAATAMLTRLQRCQA